jgi:hypothetical protein
MFCRSWGLARKRRMSDERYSAAPVVLMICLTGMCVCVGLLFFVVEPTGGHGVAHARFPTTMYQGNIGSDRLAEVRWLGLAFALLQATFFVVILLLGNRRRGQMLVWFMTGGLLYAATFIALAVVDSFYAEGGARDIVFGLPLPTAIMVYGVGGVPIVFTIYYVLHFDRWVLQSDDLQRIVELAEQRRVAQTETAD